MSAEWDNFTANLDPKKVEQERFTPPKPNERPGSPADRRMRFLHGLAVARRRGRDIHSDADRAHGRTRLIEANRESKGYDRHAVTTDKQMEIAIAALNKQAQQGRNETAA